MKLTILKKTVKEGVGRNGSPYRIASLFVRFTDKATYDNIVDFLLKEGADKDVIDRFCKPNEYNGEISYAFGLNCSSFTFDRVSQWGELDTLVSFRVTESGYINATIPIVNRIEQINGYTPPEDEVGGWACGNAPSLLEKEKDDFSDWDKVGAAMTRKVEESPLNTKEINEQLERREREVQAIMENDSFDDLPF